MSDYAEHLISMAGGDGDVLDQIQRRADKATDGPWNACDGSYNVYDAEGYMVCADLADGETSAFIAHARTDIPALLAMVREQRARLDELLALDDEGHEPVYDFSGDPLSDYYAATSVPECCEGLRDACSECVRAAITATEGAE